MIHHQTSLSSASCPTTHWDKLQPHSLAGTVWADAKDAEGMGLNLGELDALFAIEDANKKEAANIGAGGPIKPKEVNLIDSKRSLNISICLAGLRVPFKTIKDALLKMVRRCMLTPGFCS